MKRLVLELENDEHQAFKLKATKQEKSMRDVLRELIRQWLKSPKS